MIVHKELTKRHVMETQNTFFNITRTLSKREFQKRKPIKSKKWDSPHYSLLFHWEEHFTEVLNRDCLNEK